MLGPFATTSRLTPTHQVSLPVLSRAACASMSTTPTTTTTTTMTTTTTTRDRGDRYGPMEWAQGMGPISFLCQLFAVLYFVVLYDVPTLCWEIKITNMSSLQMIVRQQVNSAKVKSSYRSLTNDDDHATATPRTTWKPTKLWVRSRSVRPAVDGWPLLWVNRPLLISQLGQLSLSSFRG